MNNKLVFPHTLTLIRNNNDYKKNYNFCSIRRPLTRITDRRLTANRKFSANNKDAFNYQNQNIQTIQCPQLNFKNHQNNQENKINSNKSIEKRTSTIKCLGIQSDNLKLSDFKQGHKIGEGSYSIVKLFYKDNVKYACKIFKKPLSQQMIEIIKKEVQILRTLNHQNIVKLHYYFEDTHYIYLVMEYIEGKTLKGLLKKQLLQREVKHLFKQLVQGVGYLHGNNVFHRDLKLDNIMVQDNTNRIVIIDFGFGTTNTRKLRMYCGTPSYMCPQIVSRSSYFGSKADVWSLGIILYKMLTGNFPFKGVNELDVFGKICKSKYVKPSCCSEEVLDVLQRTLCKSQDKRITCFELLQLSWLI